MIEPWATSDVLGRRRPAHKMSSPSNAPEREGKGTPNDADDSGDEDVFHDAQAYDRSRMLTSIFLAIATPKRSPRNQIRSKSAVSRDKL